ncbi:MAG: Jag N-terminal domain-containing protein, partial [Anaerolineaceae bacterium]|nr:Jag N-terminal domain-containing protein [Anaerolineaceae bacterium]
MPQEKTTLEVIAPTTDEAIANGLKQLGISEDLVDVEILDAGSRGLLGIGGRQSRVRLTIKAEPEKAAESKPQSATSSSSASASEMVEYRESKSIDVDALSEDEKQALKVSKTVVVELLERMRVKAVVEPCYIAPEDDKDERIILI